jgi:hypothetical protein
MLNKLQRKNIQPNRLKKSIIILLTHFLAKELHIRKKMG